MSPRDLRTTAASDPVLGPLLERLAALESANYRLKNNLSERSFAIESRNATLNEQLSRAKEEIARHQEMLENVCAEILVAAQARDRAQAETEENLKVRAEAVSQLAAAKGELDAARTASADRDAVAANRDALRQQLDAALKACAEGAELSEHSSRALDQALRSAQAASEESAKIRAEAAAQREHLRLQLEQARRVNAAFEAEGAETRRKLGEEVHAARVAAEESFKARAQIAAERDGLLIRLDEATKACGAFEDIIRSTRAAAESSSRVRADLVRERDNLRRLLDDVQKASADEKARGALVENDIRALKAEAEASLKFRAELTAERDALRLQLDNALKASAEIEYPAVENALEPGWAKLLHLVKPPLQAAYAHLRRLSAGPMSAGQRAVLRLTGSSLSQAADSLATIELALSDSPAAMEAAPILPALETALAAWDTVLRRRGITLTRQFSREAQEAPHDPEQLRLALHHVLRNAVEALPRAASVRVRLGKNASGAVEIEFHDDGPGYPAAWLERQFEPFASPRPGHAGLGLAAVRRALRRWGGDAAVSLGHGRGAMLTLTFAPAPARPAAKL